MEKNVKMTQGMIVEANQKLDEFARALNEADSTKKKLQVESQDLTRQIEETENAIAALQKNKISLTTQLEDTKRLGDAEARDRASLMTKYKNLMTEAENLRMRIDEESEKKNDALRALSKAQAEIQLWKSKYEVEALGRIDELEGGRNKLASRVQEAEEVKDLLDQLGDGGRSIHELDKQRRRLECEKEELQALEWAESALEAEENKV